MMKYALVTIFVAMLLTGCVGASILLSDERIRSNTAGILGVPPAEVTIENRRTEMTNTYYTAKTKKGKYACIINGGNLMTFGMINGPVCNPASGSTQSSNDSTGTGNNILSLFGQPGTNSSNNSQDTLRSDSSSSVISSVNAKLNQTPSEKGKVLKNLKKGEAVNVILEEGEWYLIMLKSKETGWCNKKYLKCCSQ